MLLGINAGVFLVMIAVNLAGILNFMIGVINIMICHRLLH
jgi:hypothetical protein